MTESPRPSGARKKSLKERERPPGETPEKHGYFRSFDGTKLFYSEEGSGKPLIFCYGLVCSSLHWTYQIEHFRKDYRAVWMDYRGHQNSETPAYFVSITHETHARDLKALSDHNKNVHALYLAQTNCVYL
jgi:pimeloyl-ACP methyl ester carboxylesterase